MAYGNLIKNKIQNVFGDWFDQLTIERKLSNDQMECMQFGICNSEFAIMIQDKLWNLPF